MHMREHGRRLREQHNEVTRQTILESARRLFAEKGYTGASMKAMAELSGVAVQTIYSTFGSKGGVLAAMVQLVEQESGVHQTSEEMRQTTNPQEAVALFARQRRLIRQRCGDIIRILRTGASVDDEVAAVWSEGMRGRRVGLGKMMERVREHGALKSELTPQRAADIAAALVTDEVCDVLVEHGGWSFDEYESWLRETMATLLLNPTSDKVS